MANEDGSEDRLTKNEFAELIQHLSVQEILAIEYRIGTNWNKLFSRKILPTHPFLCNLCVLETSSFKNLLAHIDGRKHKLQMERVKQLYHPDYTYPKVNSKEALREETLKSIENSKTNTLKLETNLEKKLTAAKGIIDNSKKSDACIEEPSEREKCGDSICEKKQEKQATSTPSAPSAPSDKIDMKMKHVSPNEDNKSKCNQETLNLKSDSKDTNMISKRLSDKRSLANSNAGKSVDLKKRKIVINPAAALSSKAACEKTKEVKIGESFNNKKPVYQTDRILTPTVHKNVTCSDKGSPILTLQTQYNSPPEFSMKSYSSKPSDNDVHGILGVEYVIKILKNRNDLSPRYECGLCELVLDGFAMQRHLEGYNHRLKYCEKHFPTAIRQYRQYMQNVPEPEVFKVMAPVLAKLAIAIEQHHGRNLPYECYERDFSSNRHEILAKAFSCRHASEQYGPTFTHVVGSNEVDDFINNRHMYMPPSFSRIAIFDNQPCGISNKSNNRHQNFNYAEKQSNSRGRHLHAVRDNATSDDSSYKSYMSSGLHKDIFPSSSIYMPEDGNPVQQVDDATYNLMVDDFLKGTLKGVSRKSSLRDIRKRSPSPIRNVSSVKRKSLSPLRENDIWQAYRHMVDQELYNLDERFEQYRKEPETHPCYNEEWQKFWKRRKDELVSAGIDHRKYNYQPEWVRFVKIRIEELYGQEIENIKIKSRERLCLPLTNEHISDVKYHVQSRKSNLSNEIITTEYNTAPNIGISTPLNSLQSPENNSPQVVSVLRLMTALEESLGSLGPKIIDLLSKALQTEKINPLHVNAIILNEDNCSLIETAKEKFKGLVITGLFEGSKKKVLSQVVNDAEALLHYAYKNKQQLTSQRNAIETSVNQTHSNLFHSVESPSAKTSKNQSVGSNFLNKKAQSSSSYLTDTLLTRVDKKELASKLAASLVAQGKTDFDPQHLQQLIAVYNLIEKKKRESSNTVLSNNSSMQDSTSTKKMLSDTLSDLLKPSSSSVNQTYDFTNISKTSHIAAGSSNLKSIGSQFSPDDADIFGKILPSSSVTNVSKTSHIAAGSSNLKSVGSQFSSVGADIFGNRLSSGSDTSVLQNSRDNFFNSTAQSMSNAFGTNCGGGNRFQQQSDYGISYANNLPPNQHNSNMSNLQSNQYQNNSRMARNWGWNSNMEINQNNNMVAPSNNFNQNFNWRNF